eukprot:359446-Chlamydomonas_euryale.AAC.8
MASSTGPKTTLGDEASTRNDGLKHARMLDTQRQCPRVPQKREYSKKFAQRRAEATTAKSVGPRAGGQDRRHRCLVVKQAPTLLANDAWRDMSWKRVSQSGGSTAHGAQESGKISHRCRPAQVPNCLSAADLYSGCGAASQQPPCPPPPNPWV